MTESHVNIREVQALSDSLSALGGKLDDLLVKSNEEARQMGELNATVKAINERLERMEKDNDRERDRLDRETQRNREQLEEAKKETKAQIDNLYRMHRENADGKLKWWGQVILVVIAAAIGAVLSKMNMR